MAQLSLSLLGTFQVTLDGIPVNKFKSNKIRALLAYLAVEADRPHRREMLAGLLWPEWSNREALSNLRYSLSDLRRVIGDREAKPPFLLISRDSLQINPDCDFQLDVKNFKEHIKVKKSDRLFVEILEKSVNLYRGNFLEGFTLEDSPTFDEWALLTRERLARGASNALQALSEYFEHQEENEKAQSFVWRQLELEPWNEVAHRRLMSMMAKGGQRNAALAQYENCRKILAEELGVEPAEETIQLYEQIRGGEMNLLTPPSDNKSERETKLPSFLEKDAPSVEATVFVAREKELDQLDEFLTQAFAGQGKVVFVTGEAGSGKTALIDEFTRQSLDAHADLLVASGNCNAYTGVGDPYLPFRETLELLTGDVEARWAAGAINREHALRLWNKIPITAQTLMEFGSDLVDTFVQRTALLERAKSCASGRTEWLMRLDEFLGQKPVTATLHQVDLFEQYTRMLQTLEKKNPLLLVVDDLQWADAGSINLLFHLGRRLAGCRILILCAYRSEEVALGRDGERHPLEPVINEFRRMSGDIMMNLGQAESREFVDALLDSQPNRLDPSFHEMLYQQTQGHPLFTIELLRSLEERGDIVRDSQGRWIAGPSLDWETLPARVEAAIQERIDRLPEELRMALEVASIEGELFTAEAVARVRGVDERKFLENLSGELDRKHRLVRAQGIRRVEGQLLSRYQFRHIQFQKYLYSRIDEVVRVHLHEQIGIALENLYSTQDEVAAIAVQLARHFEEARITDKAIHYLYLAGHKAVQLSAYQESIAHLIRGLKLLDTMPDSTERAQKELDLQLDLAISWQGSNGAQVKEVYDAYSRARELCQRLGETSKFVQVLGGLSIVYYVRAEYHHARELAEEALCIAQSTKDSLLILLSNWYLSFILFCLGEYTTSHRHLKRIIDIYEPQKHHHSLLSLRGSDAGLGALAYDACCLWCLGFPEQALKRSQEALTLTRELGHPFTLADVLCFAGCLFHAMRRDGNGLQENSEALMRLANERGLTGWVAAGIRYQGEAFALQGKLHEGITQMQKGIEALRSEEVFLYFPETLCTLAETQVKSGQLEDGLATLEEALAFVEKTDERQWEAEIYRLKGEFLLMQGEDVAAESNLHKAIEISQGQSAKSLELRAVMSLSRLWGRQGKGAKARKMLTEIYNWFTEGFDTPDLIVAKELLDDLQ